MAYLLSSKLLLHYCWDHSMAFRQPWQGDIHILHVLYLEYILYTWKTFFYIYRQYL